MLQQLKERFTTVFAAAFLPVHASRDGNSLLAAAYSTGYIRLGPCTALYSLCTRVKHLETVFTEYMQLLYVMSIWPFHV